MKVRTAILCSTLGLCALLTTPAASAAGLDPEDTYLRLDAGVGWLEDLDVETDVESFSQEMDPGFRFDIAGGYEFSEFVSAELETGFLYNSAKDVDDVWWGAVPVMGNLVLKYRLDRFTPFVGGGVGGAFTLLDTSEEVENDFVFAYQVMAGVNYEINPNTTIGLIYKYFGTDDQDYDFVRIEGVNHHFLGLNLAWNF